MVRVADEIGLVWDLRGPVSRAVEKPPTSYTTELVSQLRADYESGMSAREISVKRGLDRLTVLKRLRAAGVKIRRQGLTPDEGEAAAMMYRGGQTLAQVAAHFGVAQGTVGRYLRSESVAMRPALLKATASL